MSESGVKVAFAASANLSRGAGCGNQCVSESEGRSCLHASVGAIAGLFSCYRAGSGSCHYIADTPIVCECFN